MAVNTLTIKPINWSKDPMWFEFLTDQNVNTTPNLSLYVKLYKDGLPFCELNPSFSKFNGKTDFDLSGLELVGPVAPSDESIGASAAGTAHGVACELLVSYNDMFGTPAQLPSIRVFTSEKYIIYGSTPYWYGIGSVAKDFLLHSYYDSRGNLAVKEMRKSQDEYIYLYSHTGNNVTVSFDIIYTDSTSTNSVGSFTLSMNQHKVNWINVGWNVRSMDTYADSSKTVQSYVVRVNLNGIDELIIYAIDDHDTVYDEYLLYENGIGGCEVVRCSGRHQIKIESKKEYIQSARERGSNYKDGFERVHNSQGSEAWEMNTGYYNAEYIRHLGQLFLATKVWYIDTFRKKFVNVTVRNSGANLVDYENDLYAIPFTMKFDDRPGISTFGI